MLVVDDDERNLLAIRTVLEDLADVEVATSGEEALRHLLKGEFAVILLDVYMPGMDGYETAQIIREREQTKRIPIVFLSAVNKEKRASDARLFDGRGRLCVQAGRADRAALQGRGVRRPVRHDPARSSARPSRSSGCSTRICAPMPSGCGSSRSCASPSSARRRSSKSLPIVLYLEPLERTPRWPAFISGNLAAVTGFDLDHIADHPTIWADRLHPDDRERVLAALARRQRQGAWAIEYRWQCADGQYKHFLDQAVLLRESEECRGAICRHPARRHRPQGRSSTSCSRRGRWTRSAS